MFITLKGELSASVAANGTFTASLPGNGSDLKASQAQFPITAGMLYGAMGHSLVLDSNQPLQNIRDFTVTLTNAKTVTITNKTASTWSAGSKFVLQLDFKGQRFYQDNDPVFARKLMNMVAAGTYLINLGMPAAASATGVAAAQAAAAAGNLTINGGVATNGVAYLDVARNITAVSSGAGDTTQVLTVYGLDQYGQPLRESLTLNGTTPVVGAKAFLTVTRVAISAAAAGNVSVGFGTKLGLPVFLGSAGFVLKELQDGAAATAGTFAYGITTAGGSTATTGDVRGTYTPNAAPDGAKTYELILCLPDPGNIGIPQYNG